LKNHSNSLSGLYAIANQPRGAVSYARAALEGGASIVQLRAKHSSAAELLSEATAIGRLCVERGALFIVNDSIELARLSGADGVHLGIDDQSVEAARKILGEGAIIGVSCYGDLQRAIKAQESGASYVAFGACFASNTKREAKVIDLSVIETAAKRLAIPICAIGGITAQNAALVLELGADMIAVIGALLNDTEWNARQLTKIAKEYKARRLANRA
jgi:thiamine-phosphate pyrophosphorylase